MQEYKNAALDIIHEFPDSETRSGFEQLVHYVTDRKY
jgi:octaprenyl-diphosphate synthase